MITLPHLVSALGNALSTAPGLAPSNRALSGVHVSELQDPTPYLEGGELLLTTGMPLAADQAEVHAYVTRLAARGVSALGIGLGPWAATPPPALTEACRAAGLDLVLVPDGVPFQNVSRAFWGLTLKDGTAGLRDFLGTQTALARAATRPDATAAVIRGLAQALGGWAAYVPADGAAPTVWPGDVEPLLPTLRGDLARLNRTDAHSAATFELHGQPVVAHPIMGASRTHGFLVIGSGRTLGGPDRQVISTVCTLLAMRARQREIVTDATATLGGAVVRLLHAGQTESARLVADEVGLGPLPERVRWLVLRTGPARDSATALALAERMLGTTAPGAMGGSIGGAIGGVIGGELPRALHRLQEDGTLSVLLPAGHGAGSPPRTPRPSHADGQDTDNPEELEDPAGLPLPTPLPEWAGGALSEVVALSASGQALSHTRREAEHAASGTVVLTGAQRPDRAEAWLQTLRGYERADLLSTVAAYLRCRGRWEEVARELGAHRNSVRHRIGVASELLGVDLDDPDVSAELWLALRQSPIAARPR